VRLFGRSHFPDQSLVSKVSDVGTLNPRHGLFQASMPNGLVPQRTDESVRRS
jgi:hypothetical protein